MASTKLQRGTNTPTRYTPFGSTLAREVGQMRDRMRRFLEEPFGMMPEMLAGEMAQTVGWFPAVEISENDQEFMVTAELPGMQPKDVQVEFDDGTLTIKGMREEKRDEKDRRYHLWERSYGTFLRTFDFPVAIDDANIRAENRDGLLEVHLPKKVENKPEGRRIEITPKT